MSDFKELLSYEEILRGFQRSLTNSHIGIEGALESGFGFLASKLQFDNLGLFWWDPEQRCFEMQYGFHQNTLMESEEEIGVEPSSPLWELVIDHHPVIVSESSPWIAYLPLVAQSKVVGAVRVQRAAPLPNGQILSTLPRIAVEESQDARRYPFLEDLSDILSIKIQELNRDASHRKKAQYLQAGTEVASGVVETPRLADMLEAVSRSVLQNIGFDRVRFFLMDNSKSELYGVVGLQIPGRVLKLDQERFPLKSNVNSLVDSVISSGGSSENITITAGGKVVYVHLVVGGQVIGCMAVDNLLSQQTIEPDQIATLKNLSGQIGMAILNARLFEDIEQQAITDGLTKLYVYRYFQQRLKEEIDRADRYSYSVALVMMDVDHFKTLNDTYGHQLGDAVLEFLAQHIRSNIRRIDLAARYGGDEFVLLLPEITEQEAWLMGARLLNTLKQGGLKTSSGEIVKVNITMGVALYPTDAKSSRDLIEAADQALYWAKKNTRGDICFFKSLQKKA